MSISELWAECLQCKDKCCKLQIAFPLYLTPVEKANLQGINICHPCRYFDNRGLCGIHKERPYDCRFFPLDILKVKNQLFWIFWKVKCDILLNKTHKDLEPYLEEHEKKLIPGFKNYLDDYAKFRLDELVNKYGFEILREVRL
ncbi:MAG: hypothetical protein HY934_03385 [Candidatus Firestonebacteria bacterium]|nr:hypothetical protein [Candidatus Firestonebacteria bacterium]